MRRTIAILAGLMALAVPPSCINSLDKDIPYSGDQPVMNAMLTADSPTHVVMLHLSGKHGTGSIGPAQVRCLVNGSLAATARPLSQSEALALGKDPRYNLSCYGFEASFKPGDKVRLEADTDDGKYHMSAEAEVPYPVASVAVDTVRVEDTVQNAISGNRYYAWPEGYDARISFEDRHGSKDYYRLEIIQEDSNEYYKDGKLLPATSSGRDLFWPDGTLSPILNEGTLPEQEDFDLFGTYTENKWCVFTDALFEDSRCSIKTFFEYRDMWRRFIYMQDCDYMLHSWKYRVRVLSISREEYYYLKSATLIEAGYDSDMTEPIGLPDNVDGGIGIFCIASPAECVLDMGTQLRKPSENIYTDNN